LRVPVVEARSSASASVLSAANIEQLTAADSGEEVWLTVVAELGDDTHWAPAGHEVAWAQLRLDDASPASPQSGGVAPVSVDGGYRLGDARFDARGTLVALGDLQISGPRLDVWRAPTDNDLATGGDDAARSWRELGFDRMHQRVLDVRQSDHGLTVRTRTASAGNDSGLVTTLHWSAGPDGAVHVQARIEPDGQFLRNMYRVALGLGSGDPVTLPRLGLRLGLPADLDVVTWFGLGPGEAYADTTRAVRVGRWQSSVAGMQTPYVMPQENGNRRHVRWATLTGPGDRGLEVRGEPTFELTVRPWTSEDLTAAQHPTDLVAEERIWINVDVAQTGIGSQSCGPGVLPPHRLHPHTAEYAFTLRSLR
jgi:beta-galactosidase